MQITASSPEEYLNQIPEVQLEPFSILRQTIRRNIPDGFVEEMNYGMIGYVVPHTIYPKGYHCNSKLPLPFLNIAAQKNYIALYHMGLYADPKLFKWFSEEFPKHSKTKLNIGKSCVRFKNNTQIPYELIGKLIEKMEVTDWIKLYESAFISKK